MHKNSLKSKKAKSFPHNENVMPAFMPKPYQAQPIQVRKFRYNVTASGSAAVTRALLLNRMVFQETGSTQNNRVIKAIRLDRVTVYGTGTAASNGMRAISLAWAAVQGEITAVGNAAFPPKIRSEPPLHSAASFWSITGTDESELLFTIFNLTGDVVDIDVSYVLADGFAAFVTTASATFDGLVYPYLDALVAGVYNPMLLTVPS